MTVHDSPINVNGWEGTGYSILDPEYGVGAYKISGGASGAFLAMVAAQVSIILVTLIAASAASSLIAFIAAIGAGIYSMSAHTSTITTLTQAHRDGSLSLDQLNGLITMLSLLTLITNFIGGKGKLNQDDLAKLDKAYYQIISVTVGLFVANSV